MATDADSNTDLDLDDVPEEITWPKTVGIVSIVWGSFMMMCNGCGLAGPAMQAWGQRQAVANGQKAMDMPAVMNPNTVETVAYVLSIALGAFLMASGIMLVARKPVARAMHLAFGGVWFVVMVVGLVNGIMKMSAIAAFFKDNPDHEMAKWMSPATMLLTTVAMVGIGAIWPVFCLVWFGLVKRTARAMTGRVEA